MGLVVNPQAIAREIDFQIQIGAKTADCLLGLMICRR